MPGDLSVIKIKARIDRQKSDLNAKKWTGRPVPLHRISKKKQQLKPEKKLSFRLSLGRVVRRPFSKT